MYGQPQTPQQQQHPQMTQQYRPQQEQQGGIDDQDADGEQEYGASGV